MRGAYLGLATITLFAVGCGGGLGDTPELGNVAGTVTLDGKPLPNATVTFVAQDGEQQRPATAQTNEAGEFTLKWSRAHDGAPPGKYLVKIRTGGSEDGEVVEEKVPAKYNTNTELVEEVKPGDNDFEFKLDSKGAIDDGTEGGNKNQEIYCE